MTLFTPAIVLPDNENIDKGPVRDALALILLALGGLDGSTYSASVAGEIVALGDAGTGPLQASLGLVPVSFAGRAAGHVRTQDIDLGASLNLTDFDHLGCWLKKTDATSCVITVEPHTDPTVGVLQSFKCAIKRRAGAGTVQVTSSMTNTHLSGHTRVASNGIATLEVDTVFGEWSLHGETLA